MAEEKITAEDRIEARLARLDEKLEGRFGNIEQRLARLEGGFEQMDKRQSNTESLQRWAIGLIITSWLTLVGLSITMLFKLP